MTRWPLPKRILRFGTTAVCLTALATIGSAAASRPDPFKIDLRPTSAVPAASGVALLTPARSPFGLALTRDGRIILDVAFSASGLPAPSTLGRFDTYVVWAARDDLGEMQRLGTIKAGASLASQVAYNKFLIVVTAETGSGGAKWSGPIVLRGFAPSALLENFSGKTMFNGGMPQ
jgi:hypothetical protein